MRNKAAIERRKRVAQERCGNRPLDLNWSRNYRTRARKHGLAPVVESFNINHVIAKYGDACLLCGGPFEALDHWVPVAAGGHHTLNNVAPMCNRCNRTKLLVDKEWVQLTLKSHAGRVTDGLADQGEGDGPGTVVEAVCEMCGGTGRSRQGWSANYGDQYGPCICTASGGAA